MDCDKCVGWGQLSNSVRVGIVAAYIYLVFLVLGLIIGIGGLIMGMAGAGAASNKMTNSAERMTCVPFSSLK